MIYVCQNCGTEYEHNVRAVKTDRVSKQPYIKCPKDGGSAYPKKEKKVAPKKKPAPKKPAATPKTKVEKEDE